MLDYRNIENNHNYTKNVMFLQHYQVIEYSVVN